MRNSSIGFVRELKRFPSFTLFSYAMMKLYCSNFSRLPVGNVAVFRLSKRRLLMSTSGPPPVSLPPGPPTTTGLGFVPPKPPVSRLSSSAITTTTKSLESNQDSIKFDSYFIWRKQSSPTRVAELWKHKNSKNSL